ncbi:Ketose-bisphosphate aldolase family protein [Desulfonema limicola]|uniref:Ketose-bisphosphate aldolase family protein n=1 Tax=Desulfonema limicola TaxID=45656 RepID=A0A975B6V4_9BACT|nr:class II fructose-bisphosphate aldolase [Desulfonema limicola]QTA79878.1 Ketose-bisphosphate aldolase family protein [Desulfonema limicola]
MTDFEKALKIGRTPNIVKLFPNSKALLVSGKFIDLAMQKKGRAICMAANGRSQAVIRGALQAAQRAGSVLIIEIARSEGGANAYCAVNFWNMARQVDAVCNELNITIPVAVHADHYGIKKMSDVEPAKIEIPSIFDMGITSIAVDASHMTDDKNLLASIDIIKNVVPKWAGLETEVGEIKGKDGLSTVDEALFLIQGLNAHEIFPNWIALNNGTTHGIESSGQGIQVDLTADIHKALEKYKTSGAQHGTSGNSSDRLREIAQKTRTTKANVATALQMISWGLEVNDFGNAILDNGNFIKVKNEGVTEELWAEMTSYAEKQGWKGGNFKKLNLPFENKILGQPKAVRERMAKRVEDFVYNMLVNVFNAQDTASIAIEEILKAGSYDPGPKADRIENLDDWTQEKIVERARSIISNESPEGDFDD